MIALLHALAIVPLTAWHRWCERWAERRDTRTLIGEQLLQAIRRL